MDTRREAATRDHWIRKNQGCEAGPPHRAQALPGEHGAASCRPPTPPTALLSAVSHTQDSEAASGSAGALGAGRGHRRSREQQHSGPSGTQAEPWPWLPAHACWSSGFALRKGRVLPSRPARHGPSSRSVGAQLLPAHRRLGLCSLGFQNRLARPLKAVNFPKENPVRK